MKKLSKNKKGIFYLFISILFIGIMTVVFLSYNNYSYTNKQEVIETRINTINDFIKDIDSDSKRVIYISGFRSLIALEDYITSSGEYISNPEELFRIAFYNGTVNGTNVEILENSSYQDYLEKLDVIADRIGLDVVINVSNITFYHDSPWSINVIVTTQVNITDHKNLARWRFEKDYTTSIGLQNIRDPVYSINTYGKVPNVILKTNITDYVDESTNDTSNLLFHLNNSYYVENVLAPSFLMRLRGNFSPSPYGIESLVNIQELIYQGVEYNSSKSVVDYIFFSNVTSYDIKACSVDNMPSWFKMDVNHTVKYEVDNLNYTGC